MSEPFGPAGWRPGEVAVDETAPPQPRGPWVAIGAVAALIGIGAAAVAVIGGSDSGPSTASAPTSTAATTTTAPLPVPTSAPTTTVLTFGSDGPANVPDVRALITSPPAGYEPDAAAAGLVPPEVSSSDPSVDLFAATGATWSTGPWVAIDATGGAEGFIAPPATTTVGEWPALLGRATLGDEAIVVTTPVTTFTVATKGLPAGTAAAVAGAVTVGGASDWPTVSVPAAALPGLERRGFDASFWTGGGVGDDVGWTRYQRDDGGQLVVLSRPSPAGTSPVEEAAFFLDDLRYVTIDGAPAVAGRWQDTADTVVWRRGDRAFVLSALGPTLEEQLAAAASVATPDDPGFTERAWRQVAGGRNRPMIDQATIAAQVPVGSTQGTIWATESGGWLSWWLSSRDVYVGESVPLTAPPLLRVAVEPLTPDRLTEGFTVVAIAVGDASLDGATLRLWTGDESPVDAPHAIIDAVPFAGRWGTGVVAPWSTGSVRAELIAADGVTVLATATEADLR